MTETVTIEVYPDGPDGENDVFAVTATHSPDLPQGFDSELQAWVNDEFTAEDVEGGDENAGTMEYEPNGEIVEFRAN